MTTKTYSCLELAIKNNTWHLVTNPITSSMQLDQGFPLISLDGHRFNHTKIATTFATHL
jgi:hypothetical protein